MTMSWQPNRRPNPWPGNQWSAQPPHWKNAIRAGAESKTGSNAESNAGQQGGYATHRDGFFHPSRHNQPPHHGYSTQYSAQYSPQYSTQNQRRSANRFAEALKWVGVVLFAIFAGLVIINLFSTGDNTGSENTHYQNESYEVPPVDETPPDVPVPKTQEDAEKWMKENPLYHVKVGRPVRCDTQAIDLSTASNQQLEQHLNEYIGCLMRVHGPALEQAGYKAVRPSVTVYDHPIRTRCGEVPMTNAAYCMADQQIYFASDLPKIVPEALRNTDFIVESVIAHEFSHAVQARSGILVSQAAMSQMANSKSVSNDISRRTEMQADCWAGSFNGSVAQSLDISDADQYQLSQLFYSLGDDILTGEPNYEGDHGHGENRRDWYLAGVKNEILGACNTFTAEDKKVR